MCVEQDHRVVTPAPGQSQGSQRAFLTFDFRLDIFSVDFLFIKSNHMFLEFNNKVTKFYTSYISQVGVTFKIPLPQLPKAEHAGVRYLACSQQVIIHAGPL